jgi:allantoin racemase
MTRIVAIINPVVDTGAVPMESLTRYHSDAFAMRVSFIDEGPTSIENEADAVACTPGVLRAATALVREGVDAIVINCMCDPAVAALRAQLDIPVLGTAEASMHYAAAIGLRFGLIDVLDDAREEVEAQIAGLGLQKSFAAYRAIGIPVLELHADPERTLTALVEAARGAIADGANGLLLGCTGMADLAEALEERLAADGISCPVLEPLGVTLALAGTLVGPRA